MRSRGSANLYGVQTLPARHHIVKDEIKREEGDSAVGDDPARDTGSKEEVVVRGTTREEEDDEVEEMTSNPPGKLHSLGMAAATV